MPCTSRAGAYRPRAGRRAARSSAPRVAVGEDVADGVAWRGGSSRRRLAVGVVGGLAVLLAAILIAIARYARTRLFTRPVASLLAAPLDPRRCRRQAPPDGAPHQRQRPSCPGHRRVRWRGAGVRARSWRPPFLNLRVCSRSCRSAETLTAGEPARPTRPAARARAPSRGRGRRPARPSPSRRRRYR